MISKSLVVNIVVILLFGGGNLMKNQGICFGSTVLEHAAETSSVSDA